MFIFIKGSMTKIIQEVNSDIKKIIEKNKAELNTSLIKPIHPQHQFSSNGLYCFLSGKWVLEKRII